MILDGFFLADHLLSRLPGETACMRLPEMVLAIEEWLDSKDFMEAEIGVYFRKCLIDEKSA
ncbi:hypothetical protein DDE84_04585 [Bifidobacterium tibiigranuli]|jgi:hypothetical protein|uniref:Uncharacterized protein n=1 Tax=Bifidobacterium tibiigranuli TaxID=2172043 RepID=A0A5N6S6Y1_9BIFI|nr:hypothetical protein DDE84_04585 [Bifidobacterium tibiigranuli]KAE8128934.1 hypothetical protein DDF78_04375 [Bifidobacterium tibiigranuli]